MYQGHCDICGHGAGPACDSIEAAERFLIAHKRTNYHKQNAARQG